MKPLHNPSRCGFTLLELLIVMLIMGIVAGLTGIIVSKKSSGIELKKVARGISATLRFARSRAISEKKTYFFVVNNISMTYGLHDVRISDNDELRYMNLTKALPPDVRKIKYNNVVEDLFHIEFTPQGSSSGGVVEIRDDSRKYIISINRLTGRVKVEKAQL